jgi:phosphatidylglycerol lysyltransferase
MMTGMTAILIAPNLYKRKRIGWYIAMLILAFSILAYIIRGNNMIESIPSIILFGMLAPLYKYCNVKSDPIRAQRGGKVLLGAIVFALLYTFIGLHFFADQLGFPRSLTVRNIILNVLFLDAPLLIPQNISAAFFINSVILVNSFSLLIGLVLALSPVIVRSIPEINLEKYKKTARKFAIQPIQILTLINNYIHYSYEKDPYGYISYKVSNGVAMMVGNPCTAHSPEKLIENWLLFAHERDWIPAVFQAQGELLEKLKAKGFCSIPIGVEALIDLDEFSLAGAEKQDLRTARNKAEREGWVVRNFLQSDWEKIRILDKKWLKIHGKKEIDFAMRTSTLKYLNETKTTLLFDKEDNLIAYLNNIEIPGNNSRAVDIMRRDPEINYNGVMEFLFLNEIIKAKEDGKKYYNLGVSPLANMDKALADNKLAFKLLRMIYEKQRNYYDFKGLYSFKLKFNPIIRQTHLVYPKQMSLPRVLWALLNIFIK